MGDVLRPLHAWAVDGSGSYDERAIDLGAVRAAAAEQGRRVTAGIDHMETYLAQQVADESHRGVLGPLLAGSAASGLVVHRGWVIAQWGDPDVPEMLFSATKSLVSTVAGIAFDRGRLDVDAPVVAPLELPALDAAVDRTITWQHLLQQTSGWDGELWGKPSRADAQSRLERTAAGRGGPGSQWSYNDVRVNLLCLALTVLLRRALPEVLREQVLDPLGASSFWSWHGYDGSWVDVGGISLPVVSGGAHWGGGLWMSANDLALLGQLYLRGGRCGRRQLLSEQWIERTWTPCEVQARLRLPMVAQRQPAGLSRCVGERALRPRQRRQASALDRPRARTGDRLALGRRCRATSR